MPLPRSQTAASKSSVVVSGSFSSQMKQLARSFARASTVSVSYLVDPASSHMLVSKIKPCMSKYKPLHGETANGSLNQLWFLRSYIPTWITVVILELIHAPSSDLRGKGAFIRSKPIRPHSADLW